MSIFKSAVKNCPTCHFPVFLRANQKIVAHYNDKRVRCSASETAYPTSFPLYIHLPQTGKWERQNFGNPYIREYIRRAWRRAGHATAVSNG